MKPIFDVDNSIHITKLDFYASQEKKILDLVEEIKSIKEQLSSGDSDLSLSEILNNKLDQLEKLKKYAKYSAGVDDINILLQDRIK